MTDVLSVWMPYEPVGFCTGSWTQYMLCFAQGRPEALRINNSNCGANSLAQRREGSGNPNIDSARAMKPLLYHPRCHFHMISRNAKIQKNLPLHSMWPKSVWGSQCVIISRKVCWAIKQRWSNFFGHDSRCGGTRWCSGWGTELQTGWSRDQFPMVSLEFFIGIILPAALWLWGRLSL
jgi:hypothetical protein